MNNTRFICLLIVGSITVIAIAFIWKYPDAVNANATKDTGLGEYVYLDQKNIVHISRKCPRLNYKDMRSQRIKAEVFDQYSYCHDPYQESWPVSFCPKCVDDKSYEELRELTKKNID